MKFLILISLQTFLFNSLYSQNDSFKIKVHDFDSPNHCSRLTSFDTASVISILEEEGLNTAYVFKLNEHRLLVTVKEQKYDISYLLNDGYIELIIESHPNKTLFYDKNGKLFNPKNGG